MHLGAYQEDAKDSCRKSSTDDTISISIPNIDTRERSAVGKKWRRKCGQVAEACCVALFLLLTFSPLIYYACSYSDHSRGPDKTDNEIHVERDLSYELWPWNLVGALILSMFTKY